MKRRMKGKVLALLVMVALLVPAAALLAHHGPEEVVFSTRMGDVTFTHAAHQDELKIECATCHHAGLETPKCRACHGVQSDAPKSKDAFHTLCRSCHEDKGGPTVCSDCHKK